ncbi:MAG: FAD:protein FMN transferase [Faecalibacterium sp.]|nr:FAD:protein FMN transferase [Ruminococcus sp.]MCM1392322.1 FAD:protein FMN transferase [Ruminococcus sp.]MCM1486053.1 FAD:protein FMN transferase [Faecalibacterium sp.]
MNKKAKKSSGMNPEKKKKIISAVVAVTATVIIIAVVIFYNSMKQEYDSMTKNSFTMGTVVTVKTYGDENNYAAKGTINDLVASLDKTISWRENGSAIALLNKNTHVQNSAISDVVNTCNKLSADSDGAFDLTIGNVSRLWDFDSGNEILPSDKDIKKALATVDYTSLVTTGAQIECKKGQSVDLGSVGKGYACDIVKAFLEKTEIKGAVVSVGGSIVAYGDRNKAGDKWRVAIRDPQNEKGYIGTVNIDEGFVSTSGDYEKYFEKDGKKYHHLLDARTGYPAESDLTSVTIVCGSGLLSDALSTACYVLGKDEGTKLAEKYGVGAVFIDKQMNITTVGDVDFERLAS